MVNLRFFQGWVNPKAKPIGIYVPMRLQMGSKSCMDLANAL